jgi:isopenicillin N synthase-like dioxygenase
MASSSDIDPQISTLPIIDIAPYLSVGNGKERAAMSAALHSACIEFGFFYLDLRKFVDMSEPDELTRLARAFFALPQEQKDSIAMKNEDHARGQSLCPIVVLFVTGGRLHRLCETEGECYKWEGRQS